MEMPYSVTCLVKLNPTAGFLLNQKYQKATDLTRFLRKHFGLNLRIRMAWRPIHCSKCCAEKARVLIDRRKLFQRDKKNKTRAAVYLPHARALFHNCCQSRRFGGLFHHLNRFVVDYPVYIQFTSSHFHCGHFLGLQVFLKCFGGHPGVNCIATGKYVHRCVPIFRPGVDCQMRFRNNHHAAHSVRIKCMKGGGHNSGSTFDGGALHVHFNAFPVIENFRVTFKKLCQNVSSQCVQCSVLPGLVVYD